MIDIALVIPVMYVGVLIGLLIAMSTWLAYDKRKERKQLRIIRDKESWCRDNCFGWDMCYSVHDDPDDAANELDDYCVG